MNTKAESILAIAAAILLLFTALLDPRVSAALAVALLLAFGIFKFVASR